MRGQAFLAPPPRKASYPVRTVTVSTPAGALPVRIQRRAGTKRLKLSLTTNGARITVPVRVPDREILSFLAGSHAWLVAHWGTFQIPTPEPLVPFVTAQLPANGAMWPVAWVEGAQPQLTFAVAHGFTLTVPRTARATAIAQGLLRTHWEGIIRADLGADLGPVATAIGRGPLNVIIRPVKTLWGRLSSSDEVLLDLSLALATPAARRYVWIHELCHLAERNHSPRFWAWVSRFDPHWKRQRAWLRQQGTGIKAQARALLA